MVLSRRGGVRQHRGERPHPARLGGDPRGGEIRRLLIDGRNVQGALARGAAGPLPTHVFTSQVLAAVPPDAVTELLLDGYPTGGVVGRVGPRLRVEFTKGKTADRRIAELVEQAALELGPIGVDGVVVVSDDREVGDQARRHGARVVGTAWLTQRMRTGSTLGHGRPPWPPYNSR